MPQQETRQFSQQSGLEHRGIIDGPPAGARNFFHPKMSSQVLCSVPLLLQSVTVAVPWDKAEGVY